MDEDEKRRFDAIAALWEGCWKRKRERRSYELKFSLALWTALALAIAGLTTRDLSSLGWALPLGVGVLGALMALAHYSYLAGIGRRHNEDTSLALHYENILHELASATPQAKYRSSIGRGISHDYVVFGNWSRRVQVVVTIILVIAAIASAYSAVDSAKPNSVEEPTLPQTVTTADSSPVGLPIVAMVGAFLTAAVLLIEVYRLWRDCPRLSRKVVIEGFMGRSSGEKSLVLRIMKRGVLPIELQSSGFLLPDGSDYSIWRGDQSSPLGSIHDGSIRPGHGEVFRTGMTIKGIVRHLEDGSMADLPKGIWVENTTGKRYKRSVPKSLLGEIAACKEETD